MGCPGNQQAAGGGVLLPQGLSSVHNESSQLFRSSHSNFIQSPDTVFIERYQEIFLIFSFYLNTILSNQLASDTLPLKAI